MAEEGAVNQVISVHTVESWKEQLQKGKDSGKLIVANFTHRSVAPILDEIAKKTPQVIFLKVDVDELKSLTEECSILVMPTFLFFKDGKELDIVMGNHKDELLKAISHHATVAAA